jgi:hypothetical protein
MLREMHAGKHIYLYLLAALFIAHRLAHLGMTLVPYGPDTPFWSSWWRPEVEHSVLLSNFGFGDVLIRAIGTTLRMIAMVGFIGAKSPLLKVEIRTGT